MTATPPPPPTVHVPAGWYSNGAEQRYWDGAAWTEHTAPAPGAGAAPAQAAAPQAAAAAYSGAPLMTFASHIAGKNAQVRIFPDRIEWTKAGMMGTKGADMVPMRSVSSVTSRKDGMVNTVVQVATGGGVIEMRVGHALAAQVRACLTQQMMAG